MKSLSIMGFMAFCSAGLAGCVSQPDDELEKVRQALPQQESLQLKGPDSNAAQAGNGAGAAPTNAPYATYYLFTRGVRDGVNRITALVLGTVWYIVNTKPSRYDGEEAVWGPYTDSLEPATWRFRVTHQAGQEYDYFLEGRPKASTSDQDYRTVLSGVGYAKSDERHGDGTFTIDLDVARALDPVVHQNDSGTVIVSHDLPATITEEFLPLPRSIEVSLLPSNSAAHLHIVSIAREDMSGTLAIDGLSDIDESKNTALEDVTVMSAWNPQGEGRSDVTLAGGDIPPALSPVTIVECWDRQFKQSYYEDSAGIAATSGNISACAVSGN